ncbi:MAG: transglycosylase SLT domain-containing protein [Variovorax sp.]|nr:transglycosylase SLT domain-containing protein [Variovorax sp.]
MEMMGCQDLAVPAAVMRHVVHVESSANPYAIGVVGGRLQRQPKNLEEAVATARMLEAKGYNFSLGIAQVNRHNLQKYGLDSHEKAFDPCSNLSVGSRILAGCYTSAGGDWGKAFSCYYSGNFVKGFQDGYVQKVYDSINRSTIVADITDMAIPLLPQPGHSAASQASTVNAVAARKASKQDRLVMRSLPLNPAAPNPHLPAAEKSRALHSEQQAPTQPSTPASEVFVPQVRVPGAPVTRPSAALAAAIDQADLRQGVQDSALVF